MTTEYFIKDLGLREIEAMSPLRVELGIRVVMDGDSLITLQFINSEGDVLKDVTAEIKAGKQSIADAISEQNGISLTGDATVEELVEAIAAIPPFELWLWLINNNNGAYADKIQPEWLQPLDLSSLPSNYGTKFYFSGINSDMEIYFPETNYSGILPNGAFKNAGEGCTLTIYNFKCYYNYNYILMDSLFKSVYLPDWDGAYTGGVNYMFYSMVNLEDLHFGTITSFSSYNTFNKSTKLHTIEIGPDSYFNSSLITWNPTYWTSSDEGIELLNNNLRDYFIPNLRNTIESGDDAPELRFGWARYINEENRQAIANRGWTLIV